MDIKAMLEREPFFEILNSTVKTYYRVVEKKSVFISDQRSKNTKKLFFYYKPTFLSERFLTKGMRKFLYSEYNIRGNLIKYIIGKFGVFAITNSCGLAAKKHLYLQSSNEPIAERIFISPCNRSIRFYNFEKGYVDCIVKDGYSNVYMQNQLKFRQNHKCCTIPDISAFGERWYREKVMYGNPLIRVRNEEAFIKGQTEALAYMRELADATLEYVDIALYVRDLKDELLALANKLTANPEDSDLAIFYLLSEITNQKIGGCTFKVPTAITHGDFQGGNIWLTKQGKIIIYDWETNKRRSVWYDPATFYWRLHSDPGSIDIENCIINDHRFLINDHRKDYSRDERVAIAWIILLENVVFYLDDIAQLPKGYLRNSLLEFVVQLKRSIEKG